MLEKQAGPTIAKPVSRISWLDSVRGMGIILVVVGHAERGLASFDPGAGWRWLDFLIYTFHMPLFMALVGLNIPTSLAKGRRKFLENKIATVAYPYFLWGALTFVAWDYLHHVDIVGTFSQDFLKMLWVPPSPMWFLYCIFVYSIVTYIFGIHRYLLFLSLAAYGASEFFIPESTVFYLLHFFLFFEIGIWLSAVAKQQFSNDPAYGATAYLVGAMVVFFILSIVTEMAAGKNYSSIIFFPSALFGSAMMILLSLRLKGKAEKFFCRLGKSSMAIYVMHLLFIAITRTVLNILHVPHHMLLYVTVEAIVGIAVPMLISDLIVRLNAQHLFGLGSQRLKAKTV